MSFSIRTMAADFAFSAVVSGLTCYALHQIEPVPNVNFLITVALVNGCVRPILDLLLHRTAHHFSTKNGYIDKNQKITNHKFYHLAHVFHVVSAIFTVMLYQMAGKTMGYQTPSYIHTFGYLSLSMASIHVTKQTINFISCSYNGKTVLAN